MVSYFKKKFIFVQNKYMSLSAPTRLAKGPNLSPWGVKINFEFGSLF